MKLDKAIEILNLMSKSRSVSSLEDCIDAIKLGNEALKRQLAKDTLTFAGMMEPLPGETEE